MFTRHEVARAHATRARRMLGGDTSFLANEPPLVPLFVADLFQAMEIAIKHLVIETGLVSSTEVRSRELGRGHGIQQIASLAVSRLGGRQADLVAALTFGQPPHHAELVSKMLFGAEFQRTREAYQQRQLGYGEVAEGDFAVVDGLLGWIDAVDGVVDALPRALDIVRQWHGSDAPGPFAIFVAEA